MVGLRHCTERLPRQCAQYRSLGSAAAPFLDKDFRLLADISLDAHINELCQPIQAARRPVALCHTKL